MKKIIVSCLMLSASLLSHSASAIELVEGDSVSITNGRLVVHDQYGAPLLSHVTNSSGFSRDIEVINSQSVAYWSDDAFSPNLTILDLGTLDETKFTFPGWSTVNNLSYGGIAKYGNELFITDMETWGAEAQGIIRFNLDDHSYNRFVDHQEYISVEVSSDGLLYGLRDDYWGMVDVIDPATETVASVLNIEATNPRGITIDTDGNLIIVEMDGNLNKYDQQGVLLSSYDTGYDYLSDIDMDINGNFIVANRHGQLLSVDRDFINTVIIYTDSQTGMPFVDTVVFEEIKHDAPALWGHSYRKGKWINTSLQWETTADEVDVYLNNNYLETTSAFYKDYTFEKFQSQVFTVCNAGTNDCSNTFIAN